MPLLTSGKVSNVTPLHRIDCAPPRAIYILPPFLLRCQFLSFEKVPDMTPVPPREGWEVHANMAFSHHAPLKSSGSWWHVGAHKTSTDRAHLLALAFLNRGPWKLARFSILCVIKYRVCVVNNYVGWLREWRERIHTGVEGDNR